MSGIYFVLPQQRGFVLSRMNGDREVMYLIERINGNAILQSYMQEVSAEIFDILQRLAKYQAVCLPVDKSADYQGILRDYEDCMSLLLRLGTTQRSIDSGSIFHESVAEVLVMGNLRERCGVFWNFFVNSSQRYNIFAQLLHYTGTSHHCLHPSPPSWRGVDSPARAQSLHSGLYQGGHTFTTPPCIHVERLEQIRNSAVLDCTHSCTMARNLSVLRRYIGSLPGKAHKECRFPRREELQEKYALRLDSIVPRLSKREIFLQARSCTARPEHCAETWQWKTGHMAWEMQGGSEFAQEAKKRQECTLAGPSGHTHRLLNAMKIFNSFDLEKWILVCVVWLVGSDHHSIYEVIAGAHFHGMHMYADLNSVQIVEHMLRKIS